MPTKLGRIVRWGRRGAKFTEAFLEGGERVELSDEALAVVRAHDPTHALVFVERRGRIFRYVQWVGTPAEAVQAVQDGTLRPAEVPAGVTLIGDYLLRHAAGAEGALPSDSPAQASTTSHPFPTTLAEALSRSPIGPVPSGMRDPGTDANLAAYARSLTTATWGDWQVVHLRSGTIPRVVDLYQSLIGLVGEDQANAICHIANMAGVSVNSLVLGYFVRQMNEADGHDPRLVRTWLDILDAHDGPPTGTVVKGAWGILLRDVLRFDARDECYQPFARCVDAAVFGLEGVYQLGVEVRA